MADYNKFHTFVDDILSAKHDLNGDDVLSIYLTDTEPDASAHSVKADLSEITTENGYDGPQDVNKQYSVSSGTVTVSGDEVTVTASGGEVGPFRYVVLINSSHSDDPLISWWDYGESITLKDGESFKWQPDGATSSGTIFTLS